jgi:membrane-associated phospholipid phosphatase/beta-phosphoglucomutase-like phosphatase (HAD superfamily)
VTGETARLDRARLRVGIAFLVMTAIFLMIAALVAWHAGHGLDGRVLGWVKRHPADWATHVADVFQTLGEWYVVAPVVVALAVFLIVIKRRRDAEYLTVTMILMTLLDVVLKLAINRTPPGSSAGGALPSDFSFPSGHTFAATTLCAALALIAWPTRWRWPVLAGGAALSLAMGVSRVALAYHYPSDVAAAWALGVAVALGARMLVPPAAADLTRQAAARGRPAAAPIDAVFLDWGDTLMVDDASQAGPMATWARVAAVEGAEEALQRLRPLYRVYVATNADASGEQDVRAALFRVGLDGLIDGVVSSRDVGARKPDKVFYRAALLRAGRAGLPLPAGDAVMVGDSWPNDVAGAKAAGLRVVWFNPHRAKAPAGSVVADAEIGELSKLPEALDALGGPRAVAPPDAAG